MDTTIQYPENRYIEQYDHKAFFASSIPDEKIDVFNPDYELLTATVFFAINEFRYEKRKPALSLSEDLMHLAERFNEYYGRYRFRKNRKNRLRLEKTLNRYSGYCGYKGGIIRGNIATPYMIDYRRGNFYYDRHDESTDLKLFYGPRPNPRDSTEEARPIKPITYREFADRIVHLWKRSWEGRYTKAEAFQHVAIKLEISEKTLHRKRIPIAKAIVLFGGSRTRETEFPEELTEMEEN